MNILTEAHKKLLVDLLDSGIEFLLIGGYAVNYHGYPRYTNEKFADFGNIKYLRYICNAYHYTLRWPFG